MRPRIGTGIGAAVVVLAGIAAAPAGAQQPSAIGIGVPLQQVNQQPLTPAPAAAQPEARPQAQSLVRPPPNKQVTQVIEDSDGGLSTQDCARMPTPVEMTDCLNRVSESGQYVPTPKPAPGAQMPMSYRLPLGTRQLDAPQ